MCDHDYRFHLMGAKNGCCACELEVQTELNDKQKAIIKELVEALRDLYDWQNGPPLPTYEKGWNKAMVKAAELLSKHEQ